MTRLGDPSGCEADPCNVNNSSSDANARTNDAPAPTRLMPRLTSLTVAVAMFLLGPNVAPLVAALLFDTEVGVDRGRYVDQVQRFGRERPVRENNTRDQFRVDAMVAAPGVKVVLNKDVRNPAKRRLP